MRDVSKCVLLILLLFGCSAEPANEPAEPTPGADDDDSAPTDDDDDSSSVGIDDDDSADDDDATPADYSGPAYASCVSEAQCDPGSACAAVPGYGDPFCSPPCDPAGDGGECALRGRDHDAVCLPSGRCARACHASEDVIAEDRGFPKGAEFRDPAACPDPLTCRAVDGVEPPLCAGDRAGGAGFYGTCRHPNVDGPDCPDQSSCYGGELIGVDEGICLPWCPDGLCPAPSNASQVTTLCYDIGFDYPVCALLCQPGQSECPFDQECFDAGFIGICAPIGATNPL